MAAGEPCVTTAGIKPWHPWCAPCCTVAPKQLNSPSFIPLSSTMLAPSGFIGAPTMRGISGSAGRSVTNHIFVRILKLLGSSAKVRNTMFIPIINAVSRVKWNSTKHLRQNAYTLSNKMLKKCLNWHSLLIFLSHTFPHDCRKNLEYFSLHIAPQLVKVII